MKMKSLYIHGQATDVSSGETFITSNPATGEQLAEIGQASAQDVDRAIASAQAGFKVWSVMSGIERGRILMRAVAILRERNDELAELEVKDTGKPIQELL
jgi:betaine-aldehyde dehydrogenase